VAGALISVRGDDRLKAAVLAVAAANRDLRRDINAATTSTIGPVWASEVTARAVTTLDRAALAKGARIKGGNPPSAVAASSTRKLKGGLIPADTWAPLEFGANRGKVTTYKRRGRKGGTHTVKRHTTRQLPARTRSGRVVMPAFAEVAPRTVSLWVSLVVKVYNDAVNGERG
jgi:hypothetical protein